MDPTELVRSGKLAEARQQLTATVKNRPADLSARTLLSQVLLFFGEWGRAASHLDIIATQDQRSETGVQVYRNLINAEKDRIEVLGLNKPPTFFPEAPTYAVDYLNAIGKLMEQRVEDATPLFQKVEDACPRISGKLNGEDFSGFRDTDACLAFVLEALVHDRYLWIPFDLVKSITISRPTTLLDTLWIQARVEFWKGPSIGGYLPVIYAGSFQHKEDMVKLGRMTDWVHLGGQFSRGFGQHVFEAGEWEKSMLEIEEISFDKPEPGGRK